MRILYISFADISKTNGSAINERGFIPLLYKQIGDGAHFLIPKPEDDIPANIPLEAVTFFPTSKHRSPLLWLIQQHYFAKKLKYLLKEKNFDLLVIRPDIFDFVLKRVLQNNDTPFVLKTAGGGQFNIFKRKNKFYNSLSGVNHKNFKWLLQNAEMIDVVSPIQRGSIIASFGVSETKVKWIDNGVNIEQFQPKDRLEIRKELNLQKFDHIIGFAGGFPWKRGGMQIVKALPKLKEKYPNIGGLIIGSSKEMPELKSKAKELGVWENCIFTGQIPFEQVPSYINCFDIGISQLYKEEQGASEQKVRQYLGCGKPIIVSPGSVNNFVEENKIGKIVDPLDENTFYKAVDYYLSLSSKEYDKISKQARKYAEENLSYESKVKERLEYYKEILEEND